MKSKKTLGRVLKSRREALALTQRALAKRVGVRASHVAYLENGQRKPSLSLLGRIAKTLGLNERELFLLAHPEAKELMSPSTAPEAPYKPDQAWRRFLGDRALLIRYHVTRREIRVLKHLSLLGSVLSPREFLAVLTLIRRAPGEGYRSPTR